ncbi:DUF998 domain-containing protein [Nocardioides speluncae]|uniref:DUF998 domain-containing protein n=1 Tax=Nocardioides speluncae TaxID=2670337 RepID=UPI000D6892D9|nr:DUF998 domain-containing protein [Nocardioides speluncae]
MTGPATAAAAVYLTLAGGQYLFRDGLEPHRHILSLAENGTHGWIQVTNFLLTGALTVLAAAGMRRAAPPGDGPGWAPYLIGIYGLGLVGAGIFRADPGGGFPPGTPDGVPEVTVQGAAHFAVAGIGFVAVIAAAFVMARRYRRAGRPGLRAYSVAAGTALLLAWVGLSAAPTQATTLLFVAAALHASVWTAVVVARPSGEVRA